MGRSARPGNVDLALTAGAVQVEYIDEGAQPAGIRNRNRPLSVNWRMDAPRVFRAHPYALGGVNTTMLSFNGARNGYRMGWRQSLGWDAGTGVDFPLWGRWGLRVQYLEFRQMQSDHPAYEWFGYGSVSLFCRF